MTTLDEAITAARALGAEHARYAASWTVDGNMDAENARRLLSMIEAGDPAADDYLPRRPNLSGEYADDLTPARLVAEVLPPGPDDAYRDEMVAAVCDAYEDAVSEVFEDACVAELRNAAGMEA